MRWWTSLLLIVALSTLALSAEKSQSIGERKLWSLVPPKRVAPPKVKQAAWVKNPIDAFVLAKLEARGWKPSLPANRATLLRRVTFDLTGLPPTPQELDEFVNDRSSGAYAKVVERLLASPHYGERWARHWLDLARYAESEGFKSDETRPNAWRYRDYVIRAFNDDMPYDRFVKEQLAGDEVSPDDPWAAIATAFNRHYPDESNARNIFLRRTDILHDITDTVGQVFLGMTLQCARCHDHKFDPITQRDYFRFQAFFAAMQARDEIPVAAARDLDDYRAKLAAWEQRTKPMRDEMTKLDARYRDEMRKDVLDKFPQETQDAVATPAAQRTPLQQLIADKTAPQLEVTAKVMAGKMKGDVKTRYEQMLKQLEDSRPAAPPLGVGMTDVGRQAPPHFLLTRGVWDAPAEEVKPGFIAAIDRREPTVPTPNTSTRTTGRRTVLANWIASPQHPLTARVMVNRMWLHHFGRGLVDTPSDFGLQGEKPSHPALLDWLATEFVARGWSMKEMHRLMVKSATYQQSSEAGLARRESDRDNRLLGRGTRRRLEAEAVRDALLAVSGELNPQQHGPSVFPELPAGITTRAGWPVSKTAEERNRRSVYVFVRRNMRYPLLEVFDSPDTNETCARRSCTTTAPQALALMNSELVLKHAESFARRVVLEAGSDSAQQIDRAYLLAFARRPHADERIAAQTFITRHASLTGNATAALTDFCHALLNANEFVFVN